MNQQLLDQEEELLASGKQPQSVGKEDGEVVQSGKSKQGIGEGG